MVFFKRDYDTVGEVYHGTVISAGDGLDVIGRSNETKQIVILNNKNSARNNNATKNNSKWMMYNAVFFVVLVLSVTIMLLLPLSTVDSKVGAASSMTTAGIFNFWDNNDDNDATTKKKKKKKKKKGPRKCTFDECYASTCDFDTEPYTCLTLDGSPVLGCSTYPWRNDTCDDQCNLSKCSIVSASQGEDSCKFVECDDEWCDSHTLCPKDAPYQCMSGLAMYACSTDRYLWSSKTPDDTCSQCCDSTTCVEVDLSPDPDSELDSE